MKEEILNFIRECNLSPFNTTKTQIGFSSNSIYKTRDAKSVHNKVLTKIASKFIFSDTSNILQFFSFTENINEIKKRQEFFFQIRSGGKKDNFFLKQLNSPRSFWKPKYDVIVVTENHETFNKLKEMGCPVQLIISETDVSMLESRDIVQVIDSDEYGIALESLPQSIFLDSIDEVYVERHLEKFSGWVENLKILKQNLLSKHLQEMVEDLIPLIELTGEKESSILTFEKAEEAVEKINEAVNSRLKELTITGDSLVAILSKGIIPNSLNQVINEQIKASGLPFEVVLPGIPVKLDLEELNKTIQKQSSSEFSSMAEGIKAYAHKLKKIPDKLRNLSDTLIFFDFISGISQFISEEMNFPEESKDFVIEKSGNIFLEFPQPISFHLNEKDKCSILTGANSGGKTTLIEHIIQINSLFRIGLPISGKIKIPFFSDIYYFAKNKGSMSKGAFETLLSQMSKIKPGNKTLILADEIEAVTEPGVAGDIICATANYYINQNCFLIIATHLGHEIKKTMPKNSRIDGIEAKGLTESFELIVDHNPVLGRLAHSTPELIVEKMANQERTEYFIHLNEYLKNKEKNNFNSTKESCDSLKLENQNTKEEYFS